MMKKLLLLLFCFAVKMNCFGQIVVDKNIGKAYNKAVKQLSADDQQSILSKEFEKTFSGVEIFTRFNIDTLNKKDKIIRHGTIIIRDVDIATGKVGEPDTLDNFKNENIYTPLPYAVLLKGDTLFLQIASPFFPRHIYTIVKGKVKSVYQEYQKHNNIFRLNLSQHKNEEISVPVKTSEFKLSTLNFKHGQVIYGEVEFTTDAYYVDDSDFTSGYIKMRIHGKSVFKASVVTAPNR